MFLVPVIAGCGKGGGTGTGTTAPGESRDGFYPNVPNVDYKGATFRLMGRSEDANWGELGLFSDGSDSTVLNDAVYDRNCRVEYDCNIKIEQVRVDDALASGGAFYDILLANTLASDYIADICCAGLIDACSLVTKNLFYDLKTVPYIDLEAEWWQQKINRSVSILNRQYFGFNDMMLNDKRDT